MSQLFQREGVMFGWMRVGPQNRRASLLRWWWCGCKRKKKKGSLLELAMSEDFQCPDDGATRQVLSE